MTRASQLAEGYEVHLNQMSRRPLSALSATQLVSKLRYEPQPTMELASKRVYDRLISKCLYGVVHHGRATRTLARFSLL